MTSRFQVIRPHTSPYQVLNFRDVERETLEKIPGVMYSELDTFREHLPIILLTNTHTQLSQLPKAILNSTRLIIHPNSGYDHFRLDRPLWENIPVVIGHEIRAQAVAEYSLACIFEALAQLPQHITWDKQRNWERPLIKDQECWVFGHGHIGKIISQSLIALGAKMTIVDPFIDSCPHLHLKNWREADVSKARIVIAACGLNETSEHIFNQEFFSKANPELIFINGARGRLVEENSLREFILTHEKAFAFLDVFEEEPFGQQWHGFPRVWKTSHIAGVHSGLDQAILNWEKKVLEDYLLISQSDFLVKYQRELLQNKIHQGIII